jgi:hypothetical protein
MTKDPERLETAGTDEDRRLLRAARAVRVPERIQDEVRRSLEERIRARRGPRRLFIGAGLLIAATAAAAGLPRLWTAVQPDEGRSTVVRNQARPIVLPQATPPPHPAPPPAPGRRERPPGAPREAVAAEAPPPRPLERPGLDLPGFLRGGGEIEAPAPASAAPPPPPGRLLIARSDRRDVSLAATARTVRGQVRGRAVQLTLEGTTLGGRIGDDEVLIRIFGSVRAEGHVGGRELGFRFTPTEAGWLVDATLPDVGGRVELDGARLAVQPGCDRELRASADRPGVYQGVCADDTRLRIELPAGFREMPPLARLVILAMLLPEPEALLRGRDPGLFPPP